MITPRSVTSPLTLSGGPITRFWQAQTDPLRLFEEIAATGQQVVRLPFGPLGNYVAVQGEAAREMLVTRPGDFPKETRGQRLLRALLGGSVLTTQGATWKARRRIVQPAFTKEHYRRYARQMATITAGVVDRWGDEVDLRHEMMRLTLEVACVTLFSDGLRDEAERVDQALSAALEAYRVLLAIPVLRPDTRLPVGPPARWRRAKQDLVDVVQALLTRRRSSGKDHDDLLGRLLASDLPDDAIVSEVVTMLLAGHETTANGLCWALWELACRPQLQRQIHAESAVGDPDRLRGPQVRGEVSEPCSGGASNWPAQAGRRDERNEARNLQVNHAGRPTPGHGAAQQGPTELLRAATWHDRPLTRGVWQETLRLHPPVWMMARAVGADTTLAGIPVEAGTTAFACLHVLHRGPDWADPEAFDPHRWLDGAPKPGLYLPFGAGKRKCLGERFAAMEAAIVLGEVMRRTHLSPTAGPPPVPQLSVTLRPRDPVRVRVRPL